MTKSPSHDTQLRGVSLNRNRPEHARSGGVGRRGFYVSLDFSVFPSKPREVFTVNPVSVTPPLEGQGIRVFGVARSCHSPFSLLTLVSTLLRNGRTDSRVGRDDGEGEGGITDGWTGIHRSLPAGPGSGAQPDRQVNRHVISPTRPRVSDSTRPSSSHRRLNHPLRSGRLPGRVT